MDRHAYLNDPRENPFFFFCFTKGSLSPIYNQSSNSSYIVMFIYLILFIPNELSSWAALVKLKH